MRLTGNTILITGGTSGIGRALAERFHTAGNHVIIAGRRQALLDELTAAHPGMAGYAVDMTDTNAFDTFVQAVVADHPALNVVIANAGIMPVLGPTSTVVRAWHDCIDVMLSGVLYTVEAAIPALVEQNQGGSIVITSSAAGLKGTTRSLRPKTYGMLGYTAAKHGVVGLMRSYANALGEYSIRVNSIHPTGADTPMINNDSFLGAAPEVPELFEAMTNILPVPLIQAEDMSNAVAWLVSDEARYITGATIPIDAGATAR